MRFLRLKPRRVEAARTGASEEEEEGRQGLLPFTCKQEDSSASLHKSPAMDTFQAKQRLFPSPPLVNAGSLNPKLEEETACSPQIVVLQAFIHCQGCARRLKKTLSKLQGVNTYHVDAEQEKVTVIGNVCPDNVLRSVNKVIKGTQFWAAPNKLPTSPQQLPQ